MALSFVLIPAAEPKSPAVVRVTGSLTLGPHLLDFGKRLAEHLTSHRGLGLIIDLAGVHGVDSAGLGELVVLYTTAGQHGSRLCLATASPRILRLLEITHLSGILPHFAGEAVAAEWLTEAARV